MSSTRGSIGLAVVFAFVAVAVVIVLAGALNPIGNAAPGGRPGDESIYARLAAGQPVPLTPRHVGGTPTSLDVAWTALCRSIKGSRAPRRSAADRADP